MTDGSQVGAASKPAVPAERLVSLLQMMLLMRRVEEQIIHLHDEHEGLLRSHFHVYIGQEAAGAAACAALRGDDYVFTTHRNHGHVIAKGAKPGPVIAEVIGKADGYAHGRAGTFHVAAPEVGVLHTSAIVAGNIPLAAGVAYGNQLKGTDQVTVAFFGDGAMEEGAFYEALNIAQLWKLPVLFYMENNSVTPQERPGRGSPTSDHSASRLSDVPKSFNVETVVIDGTNAETVFRTVSDLVDRIRAGEGPFLVESRTTRWPGNYGSIPTLLGGDTQIAWAWDPESVPERVRTWERESDPILLLARRLLEEGTLDRDQLLELDRGVNEEVRAAVEFALNSPWPQADAALAHAFA